MPDSQFRSLVNDCQGLLEKLVPTLAGREPDSVLTPMIHMRAREGHTDGLGVDPRFFEGDLSVFIEHAVLPYLEVFRPECLAWTFISTVDVAVVVAIDRERVEVWQRLLNRRPEPHLSGDWSPWPLDETRGRLVTPIQEALR